VRFKCTEWPNIVQEIAANKNPVFASPHAFLLPSLLFLVGTKATVLASLSNDGQVVADLLEKWGIKMIRGSSRRGALIALDELIQSAKNKEPIGLAFDGPKGPPLIAKKGAAVAAFHAAGSCYLVLMKPKKLLGFFPLYVRLKTWDKFLIPLPFAKFSLTLRNVSEGLQKITLEDYTAKVTEIINSNAKTFYAD
jgi:lysophospholipid acyltransferase (LPLAT)-like uncharacterized protein